MRSSDRSGPVSSATSPSTSARDSLRGRRVAYLWDELFRGPEMFEVISDVARERHGDVGFVGWEEFGNFHASAAEERRVLEALPELLRSHRVDLVVAAVGA